MKTKMISGIIANYWLRNVMGFDRRNSLLSNNYSQYRKMVKEMQKLSSYTVGSGRGTYHYYKPKDVETFICRKVKEMQKLAPFFEWYDATKPLQEQVQSFKRRGW